MSIATVFSKTMDKLTDNQQNGVKEFDIDESILTIERDVPFYDDKVCKLDICEKKGLQGKKPVFLLIHGGGFVAGDKHYRRELMKWCANKDYCVFNINYGLCPEYKFIEPIRHVCYALNFIENNAEKYNLDMDKIVVFGDSAGAYMACMLTILSLNKDLQKKFGVSVNAKIAGAILICGIYDTYFAASKKSTGAFMGPLMKDMIGLKKKDWDKFEYQECFKLKDYVTKDFPKVFISYSEKDILCGGQSQLLLKKLDELEHPYEVVHSTKLSDNHCYSITWVSDAARECNEKMASFMEEIKIGG